VFFERSGRVCEFINQPPPPSWQDCITSLMDPDYILRTGALPSLSHGMYLLLSFRRSPPPQNRKLDILISDSKQKVDDFMGELTF